MKSRERFLATARYQQRDRLFQREMGPYDETIKRWEREGLPRDSRWDLYGGYDRYESVVVNTALCPWFEVETLEKSGEYEIYRDSDGVIKRKRVETVYPAMPQYLDYPLKGPEQWPQFSQRLNPASPARFPTHWESLKHGYATRDYPLGLNCGSLFGWLDVGINWIYPMEVAAEMDVVAMRKRFGKQLLLAGGMDKRVLASSKAAIKEMVDRVIPLCQEGGYIPGCDHAMPQDIPWVNYLYYRQLLNSVPV